MLPKVHGIDKGLDPNLRPKTSNKALNTLVQSHVSTESKGQFHVNQSR